MSSRLSIHNRPIDASAEGRSPEVSATNRDGYQWTALSVTTIGALLASIQGSALLIALISVDPHTRQEKYPLAALLYK